MPKKPKAPDPDRLVRDQPGVYRSEDGRFTVRSDAAGAWYVGDGERTSELGLDLVLGPLATLAEAKELVRHQREAPTGQTADEAAAKAAKAPPVPARKDSPSRPSKPEPRAKPEAGAKPAGEATAAGAKARRPAAEPEPEPEPEPVPPKPAVYRARRRRTGDARDDVADTLHRIDDAWLEGRLDDMATDLDEEVVFIEDGFASRVEGRARAIRFDRDFLSSATVLEFTESDLLVDVWGDTAVATLRYELAWDADGDRHRSRGHDLFVFRRTGASWAVVFRLDTEDTPKAGS